MDHSLNLKISQFAQNLGAIEISEAARRVASERVLLLKKYLAEASVLNDEARVAEALLEGMGFEVTDSDIWEKVGQGDIVEAYDTEGRQIYCNSLFIKTTTYEIEEFLLSDTFELFTRPQVSFDAVKSTALRVLQETDAAIAVEVRPYIIQEKYSQARMKFQITHKYMCGIKSKDTGAKIGFLSTIQAVPVSEKFAVLNPSRS